MQIKTIDQLPEAAELNDGDRIIVNQTETSRADLSKVKEYIQGDLPERIENAITEVKEYTDQLLSGRNEWLAPVNKVAELKTDLDKKINYLCKVIADDKSGVYQCIAGWEEEPEWTLFDDTVDFVSKEELEAGINKHDTSDVAHNDIRQLITLEEQARQQAVEDEAQARERGDTDTLNAAKNYADGKAADISSILDGAQALTVEGSLLTRVINGTTPVARNLFNPQTVFVEGKTLISDINGTIGVVREINSSTITVETLSVSPMSAFEPTLLGNVNDFASLPQTVQEAVMLGWNTPRIDDYARVLRDETNDDRTAEWYISSIDAGNITWANPVIINTGDYQAQTTAQDTGKVLVGGATAGTFGQSIPIDTVPATGSNNLITSDAVADINAIKYTYVVDSDQKLADWANNVQGNDYTRVLIRAGTWTLNTALTGGTSIAPLAVIDTTSTGTKCVVGESGSEIVINNTRTADTYIVGIKGYLTGNYPNFSVLSRDYFMHNVNITLSTTGSGSSSSYGYGFYQCTNLTNCTGSGSSYGYGCGFSGCTNLTNCTGTGYGTGYSYGYGYGFHQCRTGFGNKRGDTASKTSTFYNCLMAQDKTGTIPSSNDWANTSAGGWNNPN